ncbi:MAG: hypothetical protein RL318_2570 [Fibrobacterota bacterium]|jgi:hypothetical protein
MNFSVRYQILPMSQEQFKGWEIERLQTEFFDGTMMDGADEDGCTGYAFKTQKLVLQDEVKLVFFQFAGALAASAILVDDEIWDEADEEGFTGRYLFLADSVTTFTPVDAQAMKQFFPDFERFSQGAQYLDAKGVSDFVAYLEPRLLNRTLEDFRPLETIADILKDAEDLYEADPELLALAQEEEI